MRHEEDYEDFAHIDAANASETLTKAENFINALKILINTELSTNNE